MTSLRLAVSVCCLVLSLASAAHASPIDKQCLHESAAIENEIGYCDALRVGNTLYISGHVGKGPMREAVAQAYDQLKAALASQGLDFHNVVKENVYAVDLDAFIENKDLRKTYYDGDFPAATWVQVSRLFRPAYAVEVELVALLPAPKTPAR